MIRRLGLAAAALLGLALASFSGQAAKPLVDPFPLRFPVVEAGSLEIEGHVVGQPRAGDGIVYFATREGYLTAVVVRSQDILWRRPVEGSEPAPGGPADASARSGVPDLRVEGSKLEAIDAKGGRSWAFAAEGAIGSAPAVRDGRVYFGDSKRMFYGLAAETGKRIWSRRLQGSALHPALVRNGIVAVAASNSVVYRLSAKGGSILSWEAIPSRVVYEPASAGSLALLTWAGSTVVALDLPSGKRAGQYDVSGVLVAGAVWSSPYVVLFVEDAESGRQRIVFLRSH